MHETDGTIADGNGEGNYQAINHILSKRDDILGIYSVSDGNLGIRAPWERRTAYAVDWGDDTGKIVGATFG